MWVYEHYITNSNLALSGSCTTNYKHRVPDSQQLLHLGHLQTQKHWFYYLLTFLCCYRKRGILICHSCFFQHYVQTRNLEYEGLLRLQVQLTDWLANSVLQLGVSLPRHVQLRKQVTDQPKEYRHVVGHYLRQVEVSQRPHQNLGTKQSFKCVRSPNHVMVQTEWYHSTCSSGLLRSSLFKEPATTRTDLMARRPQS